MKYIFLALVFCFLWAFGMGITIEYYEVKRARDKSLEGKLAQCEQQVIDGNREHNAMQKERNFWIKEANRRNK